MKTLQKKKDCGCGAPSSGCKCGSADCQKCGVTTMVRPRFFPGQLLVDGDLQLLVDYSSLKGRLHNRFLHGAGVVCGLQVGCHPCGGGKVTVGPGMALDCCGNEIIVPCPTELDINAMIRALQLTLQPGYDCGDPCDKDADPDDPHKHTTSYCLWIRYCEELTDPIAPYMSDDRCATDICQPSRVREGYSFELRCPSKEEPPDTVWDRIKCCIGDLQLADRAADDANAMSYFSERTAFASQQIRLNAPVPFDAADVDILRQGTANLQRFVAPQSQQIDKPLAEIDVRRGLDALQATAAAVVRWDLQTEEAKDQLAETLTDVVQHVSSARSTVQSAAPVLASHAATLITSARDRVLARESTAQALRWTNAELAVAESDAIPRQHFAYNAWYSPAALATITDAQIQLRDWLLQAIGKRGLFADCRLRDEILAIHIPQTNEISSSRASKISVHLVSAFLRYLVDCICAALNPPCQPCDDSAVKLACLDVENCEVVKICNLERTYVLTGLSFRYWIPFLHKIGEALEHVCCKLVLKLKPPRPEAEPHVPGWSSDRTVAYYQQTAPAARVLNDQPAISNLLRLARVTPEAAMAAVNFGGSFSSLLMNQPALDLEGRLGNLPRFQRPKPPDAVPVDGGVAAGLSARLDTLDDAMRKRLTVSTLASTSVIRELRASLEQQRTANLALEQRLARLEKL